jgi:hypothetical protein
VRLGARRKVEISRASRRTIYVIHRSSSTPWDRDRIPEGP